MKIEQLESHKNGVSFVLGEVTFAIEDFENLKIDRKEGRYKDFYLLKYHGVIAFLDVESAEKLEPILERLRNQAP